MIPESFHFLRPAWLLALVPALLLVWAALRSGTRSSAWRRVVDAHLLRHLLVAGDRPLARWPFGALALGWIAAVVALAGPAWERIPQPTWKSAQPTVVALDVSPSMDVADLEPSRLAHARHELHDVLEAAKGGQVALVLYAGETFVAAPLTDDGRVIAEMIPSLTSGVMPGAQSRPDRAIREAETLLDRAGVPGGTILLLTASAGDDPAAALEAARAAAARGREVSVIGVGTDAGAPLVDARGRMLKAKDGSPVVSRLDAGALGALAAAGGGRLAVASPSTDDVQTVLAEPPALSTSDITRAAANADAWRDAGLWLVAVPLLLAPLAFRRGWLVAVAATVLLAPAPPAHAAVWDDLWATRDQQGESALASGRAGEAAELFEDPSWKAAAEYESGAFGAAVASYSDLPGADNRYNLGNALARAGKLEEAIASYDQALAERPADTDARFNRDLVQRLLDERKRQQQEQDQQQGGQSGQGEQQEQSAGAQGQESQDQQQAQGQEGARDQQAQGQQDAQGAEERDGSRDRQQESAQESTSSDGEPQDAAESADASGSSKPEPGAQAAAEPESSEGEEPASDAARDEQRAAADPEQAADEPKGERTQATSPGEASSGDEEHAPRPRTAAGDQEPGKDSGESLADRLTRALGGEPKEPAAEEPPAHDGTASAGRPEPMSEERQAREQQLRRVPDDPGGLLRARIRRHFAERSLAQQ